MARFVDLWYGNSVDTDNDTDIYYLINYYPKRFWNDLDDGQFKMTQDALQIKDGKQQKGSWPELDERLLKVLPKGDWVFTTMPSHIGDSDTGTMNSYLESIGLKLVPTIRRKYDVPSESLSDVNEEVNPSVESDSLEPIGCVKGKNFVVFDDITITGDSLAAARTALKRAGAGHVVCFAIAKTTLL